MEAKYIAVLYCMSVTFKVCTTKAYLWIKYMPCWRFNKLMLRDANTILAEDTQQFFTPSVRKVTS